MSSQFEIGVSQKGLPARELARDQEGVVHEHVEAALPRRDAREERLDLPRRRGGRSAPRCRAPPAASTSAAVAPTVPGSARVALLARVRPVTYTVAPAAPSSSAQPFPIPRLAPVTIATRPASGLHR